MPSGTGLSHFAKAHPARYFDVGIAEEHATLFACGLATQGLQPFLAIYSTFFQRAYDMAIHDIAIQNLNVKLCMDRAGLSGDDGPTHHGLFDIGYLRHIPNWVHMQPKDEDEFVDMLWTMAHYNSGPIAVRYPRGSGTGAQIKPEPKLLEIGKAEVVKHGRNVAIFGLGNMFEVAEEAARKLEEKGISVALINPRWIKPMDTGTLEFFARSVEVVCTIEDHVLFNGFGCAVMEHLHSQMINTPVVRIGWPDQFIEHGNIPALRKKHGITADALVEKVLPLLSRKSKLTPSVALAGLIPRSAENFVCDRCNRSRIFRTSSSSYLKARFGFARPFRILPPSLMLSTNSSKSSFFIGILSQPKISKCATAQA